MDIASCVGRLLTHSLGAGPFAGRTVEWRSTTHAAAALPHRRRPARAAANDSLRSAATPAFARPRATACLASDERMKRSAPELRHVGVATLTILAKDHLARPI